MKPVSDTKGLEERSATKWPDYVVKLEEARECVRNLWRSKALREREHYHLIGIIEAAEKAAADALSQLRTQVEGLEAADKRDDAWKRFWKHERSRYEALVELAHETLGKSPDEIVKLVVAEWVNDGSKRNVADNIRRAVEILGVAKMIETGKAPSPSLRDESERAARGDE